MICPKCQHKTKEGSRFCSNCGQALVPRGDQPSKGEGEIDLAQIFEMNESVKYSSIDEIFTILPPQKPREDSRNMAKTAREQGIGNSDLEETSEFDQLEESILDQRIKRLIEEGGLGTSPKASSEPKEGAVDRPILAKDEDQSRPSPLSFLEDGEARAHPRSLDPKAEIRRYQPSEDQPAPLSLDTESGQGPYVQFIKKGLAGARVLINGGRRIFEIVGAKVYGLFSRPIESISQASSEVRRLLLIAYAGLTIFPLLLFIRNFSALASPGQLALAYLVMVFLAILIGAYRFISLLGSSFVLSHELGEMLHKQEKIFLASIFLALGEAGLFSLNKDLYGFANSLVTGRLLTSHPIFFVLLLLLQAMFFCFLSFGEVEQEKREQIFLKILGSLFLSSLILHFIGITLVHLLLNLIIPGLF